MTELLHDKPYIKYAEDVISGKIVACRAIKLACQRFLSWFERDDIYFDYEDVDRKIRFVNKLKHSTGVHNNKPFILMPWQAFLFAGVYGWKWSSNSLRVTKNVLAFMARKNAKTATCSAISLIQALCDNEPDAEVDFVANSAKQAGICFDMTRNYASSVDPNGLIFKRFRDTIKIPATKSKIQVLCSDSMSLDGYNSSTFIQDEFHAQRNLDLLNVMRSSQGMRTQPLAIIISTAGSLMDGYPLYEMRKTCIEILEGTKTDDTQFSLIYELDEDDDPMNDESCWIKANPSLGVTVLPQYLREQVQQAKNSPSLEYGTLTKNFNRFVQSQETWLHADLIKEHMQPVDIADYKNEYIYAGVDLAAVSDLACHSVLIPPNQYRKKNPDKYIFKTWVYIPESCLKDSPNRALYQHWHNKGFINVTSGNVIDYDRILYDEVEIMKTTPYAKLCYDSWNSTQWAIAATNASLPLEPYSQSLGAFNKPTKSFEILLKQGKVIIDINPCVLWCFNNVRLKRDHNDNTKPDKETYNAKIDPIISMLQALGGFLDDGGVDVSVV